MQAITAGTGFVAKAHLPAILAKLLHQLGDLISTIGDDAQVRNFTAAQPFGHRNRNRRLMDIQPYENANCGWHTYSITLPPVLTDSCCPCFV
jgi:hypothetical protein